MFLSRRGGARGGAFMRAAWVTVLSVVGGVAAAQGTATTGAVTVGTGAVGLWRSIDDETRQPKALIRITESAGVLSGRIEKLINPSRPNPVCEECTDERKGQPVEGMTILTGLKPADGASEAGSWEDGRILDPNNGKVYRAKAKLADGGRQLEVRGFIGVALFGRTQVWLREQ